jgi:hypothetical protein
VKKLLATYIVAKGQFKFTSIWLVFSARSDFGLDGVILDVASAICGSNQYHTPLAQRFIDERFINAEQSGDLGHCSDAAIHGVDNSCTKISGCCVEDHGIRGCRG